MNTTNLRDNYPKLISHMETNGYSKNYVGKFKREIEKILTSAGHRSWSCYTDVYLDVLVKHFHHLIPDTASFKRLSVTSRLV